MFEYFLTVILLTQIRRENWQSYMQEKNSIPTASMLIKAKQRLAKSVRNLRYTMRY